MTYVCIQRNLRVVWLVDEIFLGLALYMRINQRGVARLPHSISVLTTVYRMLGLYIIVVRSRALLILCGCHANIMVM